MIVKSFIVQAQGANVLKFFKTSRLYFTAEMPVLALIWTNFFKTSGSEENQTLLNPFTEFQTFLNLLSIEDATPRGITTISITTLSKMTNNIRHYVALQNKKKM